MSERKETEARERRRRWVNFGEMVAVLALIVSAAGLYNNWQSNRPGPTEVVEKKAAIPLVLRGSVDRDGKAMTLAPVESSHALDSALLGFPGGTTVAVAGDGRVTAAAVEGAMATPRKKTGDGNIRITISAHYVEAGNERTSKRSYLLRYRWQGGGLFDDADLRLTGISRA